MVSLLCLRGEWQRQEAGKRPGNTAALRPALQQAEQDKLHEELGSAGQGRARDPRGAAAERVGRLLARDEEGRESGGQARQ